MLPNAIVLQSNGDIQSSLDDQILTSLVDVDNGRSLRRVVLSSTENIELSIANQVSNENGVEVPTNRHLVRLDHNKYVTTLAKPRWVKQSAYLVVTRPSSDLFSSDLVTDLVARLIGVIENPADISEESPGQPLGASTFGDTSEGTAFKNGLLRIFAGEV